MINLIPKKYIDFIKKLPTFYTIWCIIIFFILKILPFYIIIPKYIFSVYKILILNNGLFGSYITYKHLKNIKMMYSNIPEIHIHIFLSVVHILPLFLIFFTQNDKIQNKEWVFSAFIILFQGLFYIYLNNIENVYIFTKWCNKKIIISYLFSLLSSVFVYQKISK
jgi:hypothetical protein